jgi:[protein-PII] uridylyltransferase
MPSIAASPSIAETLRQACERQRAGQTYGAAAAALRGIVEQQRTAIISRYARGDIAAARLADVMNEAIGALFAAGAEINPDAAGKLALSSVGGFGRGMLAPFSDIDLLFLHPRNDDEIRPLLDFLLYTLWDAGLKVGHAVHTPSSAVEFCGKDMTARTSFLDARYLCGAKSVYEDFHKRYEKLRKRTKKQFFAEKTAERETRHEQSQQSRFLSEPDLKEGKGGLRDLHAMQWLYKYEFDRPLDDPKAPKKLLGEQDLKAFQKCERFLWSVRVQLHALRGRADEKITFDIQPLLAERLGYGERAGMSAAERLMRHYFVNAMEIGRLTRIFSARLEEEKAGLSPRALKLLPKTLSTDEAPGKVNLKLKNGRLDFESAAKARRNPVDLFRLFRAFAKRPDFDFHPDALAIVSQSLALVTSDVRRDPVIARLFLASLVEAKDPMKLLRVMAETGLLGKYIPSFGKIIGRIEYGLYRRFSIDENVYQSIGVLAEIVRGDAEDLHPIATRIAPKQPSIAVYYVAALLHETIWSFREGSTEAAEKLVVRIARRLGLEAEEADLAAWCAARHLEMVRFAERRNLAEPYAIARFAEMVGDQRRLDLLLVLSVCHLRVVGAYSWDNWTRRLLSELYHGASAWLEGGDAALKARLDERGAKARAAAAELLGGWKEADRAAFLGQLSDAMYRNVDAALIARVADLARAAAEEGADAAVAASLKDGDVEALVYARDRTGLLSDLAGAIAAAGASVRTVQVMTTEDGRAIDLFTIQSADGAPIADPEIVKRLHASLLAAARAAPQKPFRPSRQIGDRRAIFEVAPAVRADFNASLSCLVVEAEGRDRPGLLYELTSALADIGVTIVSAHIATYGARAVDAFYLQDAPGYKITNKRRVQSIERRLLGVLADGRPARNGLTLQP